MDRLSLNNVVHFKGTTTPVPEKTMPSNLSVENQQEVCSKSASLASKGYANVQPAIIDEQKYEKMPREDLIKLLNENGIQTDIMGTDAKNVEKDYSPKELARYAWCMLDSDVNSGYASLFALFGDKNFARTKSLLKDGYDQHVIYSNLCEKEFSDDDYKRLLNIINAGNKSVLWAGPFLAKGMDDNRYQRAVDLAQRECHDFNIRLFLEQDDKSYARSLSMLDRGAKDVYAVIAGQIDDVQYKRVNALIDKKLSPNELLVLSAAGIDDVRFERLKALSEKSKDTASLIDISRLNEEQYKEANSLLDQGFLAEDTSAIVQSGFDDETKEKVKQSVRNGARASDLVEFINAGFDESEYKSAEVLSKRGIKTEFAMKIAKTGVERNEKANELFDKGEDEYTVRDITSLEDEKYKRAISLMSKGFIPKDALGLAELDDDGLDTLVEEKKLTPKNFEDLHSQYSWGIDYQRCADLARHDVDSSEAVSFQFISKQNYPRAIKALEKGATPTGAYLIGCASDETYDKVVDLSEGGFKLPQDNSLHIARLTGEEYEKAIRLLEQGIITRVPDIVRLGDAAGAKAIELAQDGIQENLIYSCAKLDDEQYAEFKEALQKGFNAETALLMATSEIDKKAVESLISEDNINPNVAYYITEMGQDYEVVEPYIVFADTLMNEGVDSEIISSLINEFEKTPQILERILMLFDLGNNDFEKMKQIALDEKKFHTIVENAELMNSKIDEIVEKELYGVELSKHDKRFLRLGAFNNKYFTPEEYIRAFVYFRDLKTKSGERILDSSTFLNKTKELNKKDIEKERLGALYNNIDELMQLNPTSLEASYVEIFLDLIQMGIVHKSAIRTLSSGDNGQEGAEIKASWTLSPNVKKDIDDMCDIVEMNTDPKNLEKEIQDAYVPTFETDEQACVLREIGDVYRLEGDDKIRIKTAPDKVHLLNISKDTYCKLFPPVERFATCQQTFGDCYCIESLMALYNDPKMRVHLLKLLSEDKDGNIAIRFPKMSPIFFEKGELPKDAEDKESYASGAKGFKLFEYAYARAKLLEKVADTKRLLPDDKVEEFYEFLKQNGENIFIYREKGEIKWTTFKEAMYRNFNKNKESDGSDKYNSYMDYLLGNGGQEIDIYNKIGLGAILYTTIGKSGEKTAEELIRKMDSMEFFENNIVHLGMDGHAYSLGAESSENGDMSYILYNPHSQGVPLRLGDLEPLKKRIQTVTIVEKK